VDLADLTVVLRARKNRDVMLAGATLDDPATTYLDLDVAMVRTRSSDRASS
jgi:bifunctional N-acetylglucosamine-1-phosphate-uridyltransferase/glucosamine-1-phosphate-acetyltransferase GlmU-like protein